MSAKSNTFENEFLAHIFQNAAITLLGDAAGVLGSSTAGSLFISLHTADPGEAGNQATSEAAYTGYARVGVARNNTAWTVTNGVATNAADVVFGACTAGTSAVTHVGIGCSSTGNGKLLYKGQITPSGGTAGQPLNVSVGITPRIPAGQISTSED
jgi:hypothetical protein